MTGVAPAGADRRVTGQAHRVGRKVRRRVGVAIAALNSGHRNMRRRLHARRGGAVVATRTVGVGRRVSEFPTRPTREGGGGAGVAGAAVVAIGGDMAGEGGCSQCAGRSLRGERAAMAGIAPAKADRRMARHTHSIDAEIRGRIGMAVAALNSRHRHMRRRCHAGRRAAIVAARAAGVGGRMGERSAQPSGGALVARLARRCGGDVVCGLAQRGRAVVAAGARPCYSGMIHDGGAAVAHRALMAISARCGGDDVVGRLANCDRAVVAAGAGSSRLAVIDEAHFPPRRCQVAALAEIGGLRMRLRLADSRRTVVAGKTLPRRPLEAPIDVAGCAVDAGMRAGERESRRKVVE